MTQKVRTAGRFIIPVLCFLLSGIHGWAQNKPVITVDQPVHDFGTIRENDGNATHTFIIKNTGSAPLTISQVVASCGCTTPQWPQEPVGIGETGNVQVTFNPAGQSGAFEKTAHIYSDALQEPYMLTIKGTIASTPEGEPVFTVDNPVFDFGIINEEDGDAIHVFRVRNTGNAPLVISHVQSSCGCTEPEWTKDPIQPGRIGDVVITYAAKNRPGPFSKSLTVYTNEKKFRQRLTVKGDVVPKQSNLKIVLSDTIGIVQIERKVFTFYTLNPNQDVTQNVWIKNYTDEDATLSIENIPPYLTVEAPEQLKSGKVERLRITANGKQTRMRGRIIHHLEWKTVTASGKTSVKILPVIVNFIDDFSKMTPTEKQNGAAIQIPQAALDFGKVKKSRRFLGIGGSKKVSLQFTVSNTGKSPLTLHSVSCDNPLLHVDMDKKTLQPEESATLTVSLNPGDMRTDFGEDIIIVSNDSKAPVREINVFAQKE
jgi:archaellum component FlaG (FlaF/FlaG flagellin family)